MTGDTADMREISDAIAPTWERRRSFVETVTTPVREWLIRELAPQPGDTVLELAAGVGETGFEAAALVGKDGRLISSDFSSVMLDAARRRGAELGVENVEYCQMDAEQIELEDDSVDRVICRFGYMLMPNPGAALAETRRVLRPGGKLALAVWSIPERNPFFTTIGRVMVDAGHVPPPDPQAPGPFALGNEERLRGLLDDAGFDEVRTEEIPVRFVFPDVDEYLQLTADTGGPLGLVLRGLPPDERDEIARHVEPALAPFAAEGRYEVPGVALVAAAS